jgi:hypothetical protein
MRKKGILGGLGLLFACTWAQAAKLELELTWDQPKAQMDLWFYDMQNTWHAVHSTEPQVRWGGPSPLDDPHMEPLDEECGRTTEPPLRYVDNQPTQCAIRKITLESFPDPALYPRLYVAAAEYLQDPSGIGTVHARMRAWQDGMLVFDQTYDLSSPGEKRPFFAIEPTTETYAVIYPIAP